MRDPYGSLMEGEISLPPVAGRKNGYGGLFVFVSRSRFGFIILVLLLPALLSLQRPEGLPYPIRGEGRNLFV
jgi:hypothetical protein